MQYHLNGYRTGDPDIHDAHPDMDKPGAGLPDTVDVLIVGCGPAGLTLAAQMSVFPDIRTRIIEQRDGPLTRGHADGISVRSMEMFQAFGFADKVKRESYWVNETTFWKPSAEQGAGIIRTGRIRDVEAGLSDMPHVILNQARVHDMYLDVMRNSPRRLVPDYNRKLATLSVDREEPFPVKVTVARTDEGHAGATETLRAKYVIGCDGARSAVRDAMGKNLTGDFANQAWGVMDVLAVSDFPDIRKKCLIQSADQGNIVLIPREGGYMGRFYIELDKLSEHERVRNRSLTIDHLIDAANRILSPYKLDVKEVAWWSVYEIGQRLTDRFDDLGDADDPRGPNVFIAGDACHTHSPKAGQGMNVSMGDAMNLGWKLASVLLGRAPAALLNTYSRERQAVAKDLIDFDREWTRVLAAGPQEGPAADDAPPKFQEYFIRHGRYTAGTAVRYDVSQLTSDQTHQNLARGFDIGMRFHSAPVVRLADANPMELGHTIRADGRWRVFAFADAGLDRLGEFCTFLQESPSSPVARHTQDDADPDSVIDVRAVYQQTHFEMSVGSLPPVLLPRKGKYGLIDYEKAFCVVDCADHDIFDMRGIDRVRGCIVVVRPDQYVAAVLPLDDHAGLERFFIGVLL